MKQILLLSTLLSAIAVPVISEEGAAENEGLSLVEEGARLFMRGILEEMEPAIKDLRGMADEIEPALRNFASEMGPAFAELMSKIDDFSAYHAPKILPNGDIIMRKKKPEEIQETTDGEIEI